MITHILFPSYPGRPNEPDPSFSREYTAAKDAGFRTTLVDAEWNFGGEVNFRKFEPGSVLLYRGWLVHPKHYQTLENAVSARDSVLHNSTETYRNGNELPRWFYEVDCTPASEWLGEREVKDYTPADVAYWVANSFDAIPLILKDYVKSRKQDWFDACFIRNAHDEKDVERVVTNFLRLTDDVRQGGLVFREYIPLRQIGIHPKSHMPLVNEHRTFFYKGEPFYSTKYWESADYGDHGAPDPAWVREVAGRVQSGFFTADCAQHEDGSWVLIEIGDGGPSGLPDASDAKTFYQKLAEITRRSREP